MKAERIIALDAFCGFTVALMILVNNPGSWVYVYTPLRHAEWEGCTPTDLVFPFFLFIVGVAASFSFKKFDFKINKKTFIKLSKRTFLIFLIGFLLNLYPFFNIGETLSPNSVLKKLETVRIFGVLQRIALAYFIGILVCLLLKSTKKIIWAGILLMLSFWIILFAYNPKNPYDMKHNACRAVDLVIPGLNHIYKGYNRNIDLKKLSFSTLNDSVFLINAQSGIKIDFEKFYLNKLSDYELNQTVGKNFVRYAVLPQKGISSCSMSECAIAQITEAKENIPFDPEGLLGAISAAATVIIGFLVGRMINFYSKNKEKTVLNMLLYGVSLTLAGMFLGQWFIISKPLWTGTYVLYTGGLAMIVLAFFIWLIDVKKCNKKLFNPFVAFGYNPLFIFVLSGLIAKSMSFSCFNIGNYPLKTWIWENIFKTIINPQFGSILYAIIFVLVLLIVAEILYLKKISLKI